MQDNKIEYRGHKFSASQGSTSNEIPNYHFSIEKKHLPVEHYQRSRYDYGSLSEAKQAAKDVIDRAYKLTEQSAENERRLTKNDFDGFMALLSDSKLPEEQRPALAIEMMKAHYQRLSINTVDTQVIGSAISDLAENIKHALNDQYGNSLGSALLDIANALEKKLQK
jgi:hypothetical protein